MKKALIIFGAISLLMFATSAAWASSYSVNFIESGGSVTVDAPPFVYTLSDSKWGLAGGLIANLSADLYITALKDPCTHEINDLLFVADGLVGFLSVFISKDCGSCDSVEIPGLTADTTYSFNSFDGAKECYSDLLRCLGEHIHVQCIYETCGVLQPGLVTLSGLLPDGNLRKDTVCFGVKSECCPVPIPGAMVLLGAGLVRLTAYARRKRN